MAGSREDGWNVEKTFREGQAKQRLDDLFFFFIEAAKKLKPKVVIAENVKGLINGNAKGWVNQIVKAFDEAGYAVQIFLFNSARMGVPQKRERVFFIAHRKDLNYPKLKMEFNSKPIPFSAVRDPYGKALPEDNLSAKLMKYRIPSDRCLADINQRVRKSGSGFTSPINHDDEPVQTITSGGYAFRMCDGLLLTDIEANSGTLGALSIIGRLEFGGNGDYYIDPNYDDSSYYINLPGFRVDDASGAVFSGKLSAPSGTIGGFTIASSSIYNGKTSYSSTTADGVYIGTDGIGLGKGTFYVTKAGYLYANNVSVTGTITSASGTIGGFTIASTKLYKTKTTYSSSTAGVYLGTDGIGLGAGSFYVTSAGYLYATNASISGTVNASSGTLSELRVTGRLYFGDHDDYYIDPNYDDGAYYVYLPGFRVDDASGAVFTGKLSAPTGTIGGFTIGTNKIYKTKTTYSSTTAGVYIGNDGIGLGAGTFYVTSAGALYATNATITGTITNAASDGWGVKIISNRIEFLQNSTTVCQMYASSNFYRANMTTLSNGLFVSSLLRVGGDLVCGKCFGVSTGNGIYVSGKLALTMGQVKVQTNTGKTRYLLFYCGILVGIGSSAYSGITDYSASTYDG